MTPKKARPKSITEYIQGAPKEARKKLREMRACIRAAAPGAAVASDPQDHRVPRSREYRDRQEMENVTRLGNEFSVLSY